MKVYVVLEGDRGCGVSVAGVFASLEAAEAFVAEHSSHYYLDWDQGHEVQD